jgi:hypothetical protein
LDGLLSTTEGIITPSSERSDVKRRRHPLRYPAILSPNKQLKMGQWMLLLLRNSLLLLRPNGLHSRVTITIITGAMTADTTVTAHNLVIATTLYSRLQLLYRQ